LFNKVWGPGKRVRLIGVGVSGLTEAARQMELFAEPKQNRAAKVARAVDAIREKYGWDAVKRATLVRRRRAKDE
jgi:hypothetical protein